MRACSTEQRRRREGCEMVKLAAPRGRGRCGSGDDTRAPWPCLVVVQGFGAPVTTSPPHDAPSNPGICAARALRAGGARGHAPWGRWRSRLRAAVAWQPQGGQRGWGGGGEGRFSSRNGDVLMLGKVGGGAWPAAHAPSPNPTQAHVTKWLRVLAFTTPIGGTVAADVACAHALTIDEPHPMVVYVCLREAAAAGDCSQSVTRGAEGLQLSGARQCRVGARPLWFRSMRRASLPCGTAQAAFWALFATKGQSTWHPTGVAQPS